MKRFLLMITIALLCVLSSCANGDEYNPDNSAVPYEEYKTVEIDGKVYRVYMPKDANWALDYFYYDLDITSNKEEWLVNSIVDLGYITTNNYDASESLLSKVYDIVSIDPVLNTLSFTANVKESNVYEIEEVLSNTSKEEISARVFITYLTVLVKTNNSKFNLAIPVYEKILKVTEEFVTDPFTSEDISKASFQSTYKK